MADRSGAATGEHATAPLAAWLAAATIGLALALGAGFAGLHLLRGTFDADELQHAHIAWLVAQGAVPYRDFWEHHGPLFGLANGALLYLTGAAPGAELIAWCRAGGGVATALTALFTALTARALGLPRLTATLAAAFFLSVFFVQDKGVECRPDTWQNAFWMAGAWVLVLALRARRPALLGLAGALMGLAVLANAKAALGPVAVLLWYAVGGRLHRLTPGQVLADLALLAAGGLVPYALVVAWFAVHDAAGAMHYYTLTWNLDAARYVVDTSNRGGEFAASLVKRALPFTLAAAAGLMLWLRDLRDPAGALPARAAGLVPVIAVVAAAGVALDLYSQYFLFLVPMWALLAAHGVSAGSALLARHMPRAAVPVVAVFAAVALANLAVQSARFAPRDGAALRAQRDATARVLAATPREEPVGALWDACAGFEFNANVQYWWIAYGPLGEVVARQTGTHPFGQAFVDALERNGVRYVTGTDDGALRDLPPATQAYLRERFEYSPCLWTRRTVPPAP